MSITPIELIMSQKLIPSLGVSGQLASMKAISHASSGPLVLKPSERSLISCGGKLVLVLSGWRKDQVKHLCVNGEMGISKDYCKSPVCLDYKRQHSKVYQCLDYKRCKKFFKNTSSHCEAYGVLKKPQTVITKFDSNKLGHSDSITEFVCSSQLNGANGEWTGSDDLSAPAKVAPKKKPRTKEQKVAVRKKNGVRLAAQKSYLEAEQKGGRAKELGKIIKGRGDYAESAAKIGSGIGSWLGNKAGLFMNKIFGSGDYEVQAQGVSDIRSNSLIAGSSVPAMHSDNAGASELFFHEFIGNVQMTTDFRVTSYPLDITSQLTFPWMSQIATNYQQWELVGCIFFLRSLSSNTAVAPTQGMGSVFGAIRYDVSSDQPTSKSEILNSMFASSARPSDNQALPVECSRKMTIISPMKCIPIGVKPPDLQFYQMGWLDIATEGAANSYPDALELHVTYHVRLLKPRVDNGGGTPCFSLDISGAPFPGFVSVVRPIPDTALVKQPRVNTLGCVLSGDKFVYLPQSTAADSEFFVSWSMSGTPTANLGVPFFDPLGGMIFRAGFNDQKTNSVFSPALAANSGCAAITCMAFFEYNGTGTPINPPRIGFGMNGLTLPTSGVGGSIIIIRVNPVLAGSLPSFVENQYSRLNFFMYLCDAVAGRKSQHTPPIVGSARLVDWVHHFTKVDKWNGADKAPFSMSPFDTTLVEALATISKYVNSGDAVESLCESKNEDTSEAHSTARNNKSGDGDWELEDVPPYKNNKVAPRSTRLKSSHGSITEGDDVESLRRLGGAIPPDLSQLISSYPPVLTNLIASFLEPACITCKINTVVTMLGAVSNFTFCPECHSCLCNFADFTPVYDEVRECFHFFGKDFDGTYATIYYDENYKQCLFLSVLTRGYVPFLKLDIVNSNYHHSVSQLNGNNGSWTNGDDVYEKHECHSGVGCKLPVAHYHRKKGDQKPATGALKAWLIAQQKLKREKKEELDPKKFVACDVPYPDCHNPTHFHLFNEKSFNGMSLVEFEDAPLPENKEDLQFAATKKAVFFEPLTMPIKEFTTMVETSRSPTLKVKNFPSSVTTYYYVKNNQVGICHHLFTTNHSDIKSKCEICDLPYLLLRSLTLALSGQICEHGPASTCLVCPIETNPAAAWLYANVIKPTRAIEIKSDLPIFDELDEKHGDHKDSTSGAPEVKDDSGKEVKEQPLPLLSYCLNDDCTHMSDVKCPFALADDLVNFPPLPSLPPLLPSTSPPSLPLPYSHVKEIVRKLSCLRQVTNFDDECCILKGLGCSCNPYRLSSHTNFARHNDIELRLKRKRTLGFKVGETLGDRLSAMAFPAPLAPLHPPDFKEAFVAPVLRTKDVTIYYHFDKKESQTFWSQFKTSLKNHTPFLHAKKEYHLNVTDGGTFKEEINIARNELTSHTWAWRSSMAVHNKPSFITKEDADYMYLTACNYKSHKEAPIFISLYKYLTNPAVEDVRRLLSRMPMKFDALTKLYNVIDSYIDASFNQAYRSPMASELSTFDAIIFDNTVHHFIQQSLMRRMRSCGAHQGVMKPTF